VEETKTAWEVVLGICRGGKGPQGRASGRERVTRRGEVVLIKMSGHSNQSNHGPWQSFKQRNPLNSNMIRSFTAMKSKWHWIGNRLYRRLAAGSRTKTSYEPFAGTLSAAR